MVKFWSFWPDNTRKKLRQGEGERKEDERRVEGSVTAAAGREKIIRRGATA
jgi:hypothetical protein